MLDSGYKLGDKTSDSQRGDNWFNRRLERSTKPQGNWKWLIFSVVALLAASLAVFLSMEIRSWLLVLILGIPVIIFSLLRLSWGIGIITTLSFIAPALSRAGMDVYIYWLIDLDIALIAIGALFLPTGRKASFYWVNPVSIFLIIWIVFNLLLIMHQQTELLLWSREMRRIVLPVLLFWVAVQTFHDLKRVKQYIMLILILGCMGALYAFYQDYAGVAFMEQEGLSMDDSTFKQLYLGGRFGVHAFLESASIMGVLMLGLSVLAFTFAMGPWNKIKWISVGAFFLMAGAMSLSGATGAYIILPIGLLYLTFLSLDRYIAMIVLGLLLAGGAGMYVMNDTVITERVLASFGQLRSRSEGSTVEKKEILRKHIFNHPIGIGMEKEEINPYKLLKADNETGEIVEYRYEIENGYKQMALKKGWLGLSCFMIVCLTIFWVGIRGYFFARDIRVKNLHLAINAFVFVWILAQYFYPIIDKLPISIIFYTLVGIMISLQKIERIAVAKPLASV